MTIMVATVVDAYDGNEQHTVYRIGNCFIATKQPIEWSKSDIKAMSSIGDWAGNKKPKTKLALYDIFRLSGFRTETRFDAGHGQRYALCVYPADEAFRRVAIAAQCDMSNTDAFVATAIKWAEIDD